MKIAFIYLICGTALSATAIAAPTIVLPAGRNAYYSSEPIELAVSGIQGAGTSIDVTPDSKTSPGLQPVSLAYESRDTVIVLPPNALAPGKYMISAAGAKSMPLIISDGVAKSSMLVSQVASPAMVIAGGGDFVVGNSAAWGLLDADGQPSMKLRERKSTGLATFESNIEANLPTVVYLYWTGYVLHKPFGTHKSWESPREKEAMRLLSFSNGQRMHRVATNIVAVGPIDEPGLAWGKTPAGGFASGFPDWDEKNYYQSNGWHYTQDITSGTNADWMKYMELRTRILGLAYRQASADLKSSWPTMNFSGDLYALSAVMDGTSALNQQANDVYTTHVFTDYFGGPFACVGQLYLEKAANPSTHIAHAMNGQGLGVVGPQVPLYHFELNSLLSAGLHSNWWLNFPLSSKELTEVNDPAIHLGPVFLQMSPDDHDVALLWSSTELTMREKEVAVRESKKKTGEQIKLMVPVPEKGQTTEQAVDTSAYEVGNSYQRQLLDTHQVLRRAGYAPQFIDERLLEQELPHYKVLVISEQTFDLSPEAHQAIDTFIKRGGKIVMDKACKIQLPGAITHDADFSVQTVRARLAIVDRMTKAAGKDKRAASEAGLNTLEEAPMKQSVAPVKAAMARTRARPVITTDSVELTSERHIGGEGALYMVLNGHQQTPDLPQDQPVPRYNFAPLMASYSLQGIPDKSVVYRIEGIDWQTVTKVEDFKSPQKSHFDAGEMKLYLVAPREPGGLKSSAQLLENRIVVSSTLIGVKMPWPLEIKISHGDDHTLYSVYRSTDVTGGYRESFPIGANTSGGEYSVTVSSPVGEFKSVIPVEVKSEAPHPQTLTDRVRIFDRDAMSAFLASKPRIVIALGDENQKPAADKLAAALNAKGVQASVKNEADVVHKVLYPRVWDPYCDYFKPAAEQHQPKDITPANEIEMGADVHGVISTKVKKQHDENKTPAWNTPDTLITITGTGYVDYSGDVEQVYEPGVKLYRDSTNVISVVNAVKQQVQTTAEFRAKWAKPWQHLVEFSGAYQLPPCLPEAYTTDEHLILLGDSTTGKTVAALQASDVLPQVVDQDYPGAGKALITFARSPFGVEKNVILIGAVDSNGIDAGIAALTAMLP